MTITGPAGGHVARGERSKAARLLQPGDRVRIFLGGYGQVVSVAPSASTMVKRRKAGPGEPPGLGLIVVYDLLDGPKRGTRCDHIIHPEDEVLI